MHRDLVDSLFARYREPVYRFLRRMLRDGQTAEDLTQDTRNLARDRARATRRQPPLVELEDRGAPSSDPALGISLDAALAQLTHDDREVFLLREVGGLSYAEIGSACGLTVDAVRSRLRISLFRRTLGLAILIVAPASGAAQESRPPLLWIAATNVSPDGGTRAQAAGSKDFVAGKTTAHYLHAGSTAHGGSVCTVGQADEGVRSLESL